MRVLGKGQYSGRIVRTLEVDGAIVTATRYSDAASSDWHAHENPHVSFVFEGVGLPGRGRSHSPAVSEIFFHHGGERHRWVSPGRVSKSANIELGPEFLSAFELVESDLAATIHRNSDAKFIILKLLQESLESDGLCLDSARCLLLELLHGERPIASAKLPGWVRPLAHLLRDRWDEVVSLSELSRALGVHPVTISKNFRRYFSCTLGEHQRKLKIERSLPLIKDSTLSLTEIALSCGFADQSHFSRTFKQVTHFSPRDFRSL